MNLILRDLSLSWKMRSQHWMPRVMYASIVFVPVLTAWYASGAHSKTLHRKEYTSRMLMDESQLQWLRRTKYDHVEH